MSLPETHSKLDTNETIKTSQDSEKSDAKKGIIIKASQEKPDVSNVTDLKYSIVFNNNYSVSIPVGDKILRQLRVVKEDYTQLQQKYTQLQDSNKQLKKQLDKEKENNTYLQQNCKKYNQLKEDYNQLKQQLEKEKQNNTQSQQNCTQLQESNKQQMDKQECTRLQQANQQLNIILANQVQENSSLRKQINHLCSHSSILHTDSVLPFELLEKYKDIRNQEWTTLFLDYDCISEEQCALLTFGIFKLCDVFTNESLQIFQLSLLSALNIDEKILETSLIVKTFIQDYRRFFSSRIMRSQQTTDQILKILENPEQNEAFHQNNQKLTAENWNELKKVENFLPKLTDLISRLCEIMFKMKISNDPYDQYYDTCYEQFDGSIHDTFYKKGKPKKEMKIKAFVFPCLKCKNHFLCKYSVLADDK